jgi:hypothetical protein
MKRSTTIAVILVCAGISAGALWSIGLERRAWITTGGGAKSAPPPVVSNSGETGLALAQLREAKDQPLARGTAVADDESNVKTLLKSNPESLSEENWLLVQRVVRARGSGPDDGANAMRMALALAGDRKLLAAAPAAQASEMKSLVIETLAHPVWRMRRVAIGICAENGWLSDSTIRSAIQSMFDTDVSMDVRLSAKRALEQADKAAARKAPPGP